MRKAVLFLFGVLLGPVVVQAITVLPCEIHLITEGPSVPERPTDEEDIRFLSRFFINNRNGKPLDPNVFSPSSPNIIAVSWERLLERFSGKEDAFGYMGMVFIEPEEQASTPRFIRFLAGLHEFGFKLLPPSKAGYALHMGANANTATTYFAIDGRRIKNSDYLQEAPPNIRNLPDVYLQKVISIYRDRNSLLSEEELASLMNISAAVRDRSFWILKTQQSLDDFSHLGITDLPGLQTPPTRTEVYPFGLLKGPNAPAIFERRNDTAAEALRIRNELVYERRSASRQQLSREITKLSMDPNFSMLAGATAVWSSNPTELLPLEMRLGILLPRTPGRKIVEAGRLMVDRNEVRRTTPEVMKQIVALTAALEDVDMIYIEVNDAAHRRLYTPLGFEVVQEIANAAGEVEHIMAARPSRILRTLISPK